MREIHLAGCVIRDEHDRLLLLRRNTPKRTHWEIPGGKLDPGEDPSTTAARELLEEVGVEVRVERRLGEKSFDEDGRTMVYTWFLATIASGTPTVQERDVHDRCEYLPMTDLVQMFDQLSPNVRNFVDEIRTGRITL